MWFKKSGYSRFRGAKGFMEPQIVYSPRAIADLDNEVEDCGAVIGLGVGHPGEDVPLHPLRVALCLPAVKRVPHRQDVHRGPTTDEEGKGVPWRGVVGHSAFLTDLRFENKMVDTSR